MGSLPARPQRRHDRQPGSAHHEAANDAISDGTEKITKAHLDAVILDIGRKLDEALHAPTAAPRPTDSNPESAT
jgi:hypothetical protein